MVVFFQDPTPCGFVAAAVSSYIAAAVAAASFTSGGAVRLVWWLA